jgi:hypothetical protein
MINSPSRVMSNVRLPPRAAEKLRWQARSVPGIVGFGLLFRLSHPPRPFEQEATETTEECFRLRSLRFLLFKTYLQLDTLLRMSKRMPLEDRAVGYGA